MAQPDNSARIGRSQGASIFWGLVSVFFAAAACFYFWKNHENEINADKLRDEVLFLQDERDNLKAETEKLQASKTESDAELKTRSDFLQDKENKLAAEESRLDALEQKTQSLASPSQPPPDAGPSPAVMYKKFGDTVRKLGQDNGSDVVTRDGRPVLRVPSPVFFASGDATLKPEGKTLLNQIAQALNAQADHFELRVESFTESDAEIDKSANEEPPRPSNVPKKEKDDSAKAAPAPPPPRYATSWDLTAARAAAIARYFRDETSLPFQNVLVLARGDSEPIVTGDKEGHARNRRIEIMIAPVPVNPLAPPPDPPAPAKKSN